jgi:hypothetical protein
MSRRQTDYATIRLLASIVAFPLFWALETSLVGWVAGLRWALAFFLSLPLGGLIAYRYLVGTGRLRHQLRFGALLLTRAQEARRLLAERREIVEELERAKRDYWRARKDLGVEVDVGRRQIMPKCRSASSIASRFSGGHGSMSRPRRARFAPRRVGMP